MIADASFGAAIGPIPAAMAADALVVVTTFDCGSRRRLLRYRYLHRRMKREVPAHSDGLLAAASQWDWKARRMTSISLWESATAIASLGETSHVRVARIPKRDGVRTTCEVFLPAGNWSDVLFAGQQAPR